MNKQKRVLLEYSLLFVAMSAVVFSYFYLNGKTFIHGDGWLQHYKALIYYSDYLKSIFRKLFVERSIEIPHFDLSIGEGSDILVSLQYYCIGDPIAFLSVLVPKDHMYVFYDFSILLRIYLCGIVFLLLCLYTKKENEFALLSGAVIYVFCYWNLLNVSKHIFFLNPMIYLPLVILGTEKIIRGEKSYLMTIAVFLAALNNFYFFYMIVVLTILYVAIRLVVLYKRDIGKMALVVEKILIPSLVGFLMSAAVSFPTIYALLTNGRLGADYGVHLLYPIFYYERLTAILLTPDNDYWLCMGFASPVILSFLMSIRRLKKDPLLFVLNVVAVILFCLPICGKILNGFAYVSNRWSFALALIFSYTFVSEWEEYEGHKKYVLISGILFNLFCLVSAWWRDVKLIPVMMCLIFLGVVLFFPNKKKMIKQAVLLIIVVMNIFYVADYSYSVRGRNRIKGASSVEEAKTVITSTEAYAYKNEIFDKNPGFYRYSGNALTTNAAMLSGAYSTDYYFSIANPDVASYRDTLGVNEYSTYRYSGYDNRFVLYTLANVRDFITIKGYEGILPYGFEKTSGFDNYDLYQNVHPLHFGYTYKKAISYDEWMKLSQVEREEALLSYVVIDGGRDAVKELSAKKAEYEIISSENVEISDGSFDVKEDKGSITLEIKGINDSLDYLTIERIRYDDLQDPIFGDVVTDVNLEISTSTGISNSIEYHTNDYQFYNGKESFTAYLGENKESVSTITIVFSRKGIYSYDELYVSCLPVERLFEKVDALNEKHLEDVEIGIDSISGKIDMDESRYLLLSVPYSKGWKAYIDGKESRLYKANGAYMALSLEKGYHEIKLSYKTPFLSLGTGVSLASAIIFVIYLVSGQRRKRS